MVKGTSCWKRRKLQPQSILTFTLETTWNIWNYRTKPKNEKLKEITEQNTARATPKSNLTRLQKHCLQKIMSDKCYIVCLSDKNLGPVLMECRKYFECCLSDHLLCSNTYIQLTEKEATEQMLHTRKALLQLWLNHRNDLTETENTYFRCNANKTSSTTILYHYKNPQTTLQNSTYSQLCW